MERKRIGFPLPSQLIIKDAPVFILPPQFIIKDAPITEEEKTTICRTKLEDVRELIHHIQSLLPAPEASRTCILSKAWAQAWSTIPILRFSRWFICRKKERKYYHQINRTLLRYHRDNIPIQSFYLQFHARNKKSVSLVKRWIQLVALKPSLKEFSLGILAETDSVTLPEDIFSGQHLNTINVTNNDRTNSLWICSSTIKCVSLRVLHLEDVNISEVVLDNLFSTCTLLEKINLNCCGGFKTIKVKKLCFLRELKIITMEDDDFLEIDDVPSLRLFHYSSIVSSRWKLLPFCLDAIACVTDLYIGGVVLDDAFFNTIKLKFPFLHTLTIGISFLGDEKSFVITSASLKRLTIRLWVTRSMDIQVYAPKLLIVNFEGGNIVPNISFPSTAPDQVKLIVT